MGVTINQDKTVVIVNDLGTCRLPNYNPVTLLPWSSDAEITAYVATIQADARYFSQPRPKRTVLTPVEFKMQFTAQERIATKVAAEAGDELLVDFLEVLNDPRLKEVILTLPENIQAISYLVSIEILTADRAIEILSGIQG